MIGQAVETKPRDGSVDLDGLVAVDGSASHPLVNRLIANDAPPSMLADAIHLLCLLHGRHPGVMDAAADRLSHPVAGDWMKASASAFAIERKFLTRLVVAAGPIPSTPRQSQSQSAVMAQANALAVLARSERRGTALGTALALALDWAAIRPVLDRAARRFDLDAPPARLPDRRETAAVASIAGDTLATARALDFGARQLLIQHRGFWDLLESRAVARG